jgi:hypothetical protein
MESTRRGFLAGAAGVTGWLLFGKGAEAAAKAEGNRVLREFDEDVEGFPHHVIEMQLTYDNPMLQFDVPLPDSDFDGLQISIPRRQTVGRHTATELVDYHKRSQPDGDIWGIIRQRVPQMAQARVKNPAYGDHKMHIATVVCHCPSGIEVGMTVLPVGVTVEDMHLTIPATLLPQS